MRHAGGSLRWQTCGVLASNTQTDHSRSMELVTLVILASSALLGLALLERLTSDRTSQDAFDVGGA